MAAVGAAASGAATGSAAAARPGRRRSTNPSSRSPTTTSSSRSPASSTCSTTTPSSGPPGYLPGPNDVYVLARPGQAVLAAQGRRRHRLDQGAPRGRAAAERHRRRQKFNALVRLDTVNGAAAGRRPSTRVDFGKLTPLYPQERLRLETETSNLTTRVIDLVAPIGKGQRGLIVSPSEGRQDDGPAGDRQRDHARTTRSATSWSSSSTSGPRRSPTCSAR